MPRDGSLTLSDVRGPTLTIACEPAAGAAATNVDKLMADHGAPSGAEATCFAVSRLTVGIGACLSGGYYGDIFDLR
jgi:hypothetical protein